MKFSQDNLIQIYLDGVFTEEAQAEFDRLMQKDPLFAEKVTQAVAQRVGPAPEEALAQAEARLDARMPSVWEAHRPSPWNGLGRKVSLLLSLALGTGLLCLGYKTLGGKMLSSFVQGKGAQEAAVELKPKTLRLSHVGKAPAQAHQGSQANAAREEEEDSSITLPQAHTSSLETRKGPSSSSVSSSAQEAPASDLLWKTEKGSPDASAPSSGRAPEPGLPALSQEGFPLRLEVETDLKDEVVITVLDPGGLPVRSVFRGTMDAGTHYVDWDGLDNSGKALPPGDYTVVFKAGQKVRSGTVKIQP